MTIVYHLCGLTILGRTPLEPLGTLPVPVRTAVLEVAQSVDPEGILLSRPRLLEWAKGQRRSIYRWFDWWRFAQDEVKNALQRTDPGELLSYKSLNDFIQRYNLGKPKDDSLDEHYAERLFLEKAFLPIFGIAGLSLLKAQSVFRDALERQRRIDFVLLGAKQYALEIEGAKHDLAKISAQRFEDEKQRQRSLSDKGYTYIPFTLADILEGRAKAQLKDMTFADPILKRLIPLDPELEQARPNPTLLYLKALLVRFPLRYPLYQEVALRILWEAMNQNKKRIVVVDWQPILALLPVALLDTVDLVERVAQLYGLEVELPPLDIYIVGTYDQIGVYEVLKRYLGVEPGQGDLRIDAGKTPVNIHFVEDLPPSDYVFAGEAVEIPPIYDSLWGASLERFPASFLRAVGDPPPIILPRLASREVLDYFARRYFLVPELKSRQYELLAKILNQDSVLGILPTGYGKSLVFQLYSIFVLGTTLVISPLRTLIRDQLQNLHRQGLTCAESITSQDNSSSKARKYKGL